MPQTKNGGTNIYWEVHGRGEPLVLINGLGYSLDMWFRLLPALAARFRTIVLDNRGVGRSDAPEGSYSIPQMASDVAAVMDAAGVKRAHVLGHSMGGMIAQELALSFRDRVRSLLLACTSCGGFRASVAAPHVLGQLFSRAHLSPEASARALVPYIYHPATPKRRIDEDIARRLECYPSRAGYMGQLRGLFDWTSFPRLAAIAMPTFILHGEADALVPARNADILAGQIRGAQVKLLARASHVFYTDQPRASQHAILGFLEQIAT